ncbi:hypothetical protein GCM10011403_16970 [Pseudohongiella nitratireducens]|uniref:Uncharacterized protein n=1 Tax=Pseudohongiella nitratireducens TaxID=1768907 RepID=A0A917GYA7_9GAMM|nr:hypothetical protein GCM10011403_16970 [Pseudohongiella nitratireducens]
MASLYSKPAWSLANEMLVIGSCFITLPLLALVTKIYLLEEAKPIPKLTNTTPLTLFKATLPLEEESLDLAKEEKSA